jgi:hypothetical protein
MSYVIDFKASFTKNLPGKTFSPWLQTVEYADLQGLFPEIAEADWPSIKSDILNYYSSSRAIVGQTPGVATYSEEITDNDVHITLTFNTKEDYDLYVKDCHDNKRIGIQYGFANIVPEKTIDQAYSVVGRSVTCNIYDVNPVATIEGWLVGTYHVTYGVTRSCTHSQI